MNIFNIFGRKKSKDRGGLFPDKSDEELRDMLSEAIRESYPDLFEKKYSKEESERIDREFQEIFDRVQKSKKLYDNHD